jgi:hypothetical protein
MILRLIIIFFSFLIIKQVFFKSVIVEGASNYQDYSDDPLILAQKNAGNISSMNEEIKELKANVDKNTKDIASTKSLAESNKKNFDAMIKAQQGNSQEDSKAVQESVGI